jgi:hydroxymethylpyrimidine/phosphomethylpyrimidine kinase
MLLPQTTLLTPNAPEARRLAESDEDENEPSIDVCAQRLIEMGAQYVLITGTHENTPQVINTLYGPEGVLRHDQWERLPGSYHGSGCTLASAIAGCIAGGASVEDAVRDAQDYTWQTLKNGFHAGMGQLIPDRFFWARGDEETDEAGEKKPGRKLMAMPRPELRGLYAVTPDCADGARQCWPTSRLRWPAAVAWCSTATN